MNPDILLNGLGPVGCHVILEDIWEQAVPLGFYGQGLRDFDVENPWVDDRGNGRPGGPPWVSDEVTKFVGVLKRQWLLYDLSEDLPPTCWPPVRCIEVLMEAVGSRDSSRLRLDCSSEQQVAPIAPCSLFFIFT